jgi:peptidoglycan/xylan/chitin deacetylase (PgdA/CDA1 family)/SAM-dependent methyltransferase
VTAVAVVVVCRDGGRALESTLGSLAVQTRRSAETVVVDEESTDLHTRRLVAELGQGGTRVVPARAGGGAAARNQGVRAATEPYVLMLAPGVVLRPTFIESTASRLDADAGLGLVWTSMEAPAGGADPSVPATCRLPELLATGSPPPVLLFRRSAWEAVGRFDEALGDGLDVLDFAISAVERGLRGEVLPDALARLDSERPRASPTAIAALLAKHRASVEALGPEVLVAREAALLRWRDYQRSVDRRRAALEDEFVALGREIAVVARALRARGAASVEWGDLRRPAPISEVWGVDRGQPVDRYYIESFLARHQGDIRGRVLEVKDAGYATRFGGGRVARADVVDIDPANPHATFVADLADAGSIPTAVFDCFILTQTLHVVYDARGALRHAYRVLKPGGVLLCTLPSVSRINFEDGGRDRGDYWRFTEASARRLFAEVFPPEAVEVTPVGNVLACTAFLHGLSTCELTPEELGHADPWFPLLLCVRAVKRAAPDPATGPGGPRVAPAVARAGETAVVLAYHRVAAVSPDPFELCVSPAEFRAQMEHIRRHYRPMALEALVRAAATARLPEGAVAVTLDDGYLDALEVASPILEELGVPATFYVGTERLDEAHEWWWDVLTHALLGDGPAPPVLEIRLPERAARLGTRTPEERRTALEELAGAIRQVGRSERDELLGRIVEWSGLRPTPRASHRVMTAPEVRRLGQRPGHAIGAHTIHHLALPRQPRAVQREEILGGKARLEQLLGRPVTTFAYPYGQVDAAAIELVRAAGFAAAVTVDPGPVRRGLDPLRVPRYEVTARTGEGFPAWLPGAFVPGRAPR